MFFLFRRKERTKEKPFRSFSRMAYLVQALLEGYIREAALLSCDAYPAQSQRRLLLAMFAAHASYNLSSFGIPRMGASCIDSFPPRHVRHPSAAQM